MIYEDMVSQNDLAGVCTSTYPERLQQKIEGTELIATLASSCLEFAEKFDVQETGSSTAIQMGCYQCPGIRSPIVNNPQYPTIQWGDGPKREPQNGILGIPL